MQSPNSCYVDHSVCSPLYTLLLPFRTAPYTDGRSWVKQEGLERHIGIREGEEYTDEE
jgi:palmitoyltransferase